MIFQHFYSCSGTWCL